MARKSRKHLFGREPADKILKNEPKIYKTGAYVRLSVINNENKESIENQIEIIKEFIS